MTGFIDDGLLQDSLEDPIPFLDSKQSMVIDLDDIDSTIEDPAFIIEESLDTFEFDQKEEYTSSYRKRSYTLPVTFFDNSRNISLLKKCRPISVKIVDCGIYPWYYKRHYKYDENTVILIKDDEPKAQMLHNGREDLLLEQSGSNFKLKEVVEQDIYLRKNNDKVIEDKTPFNEPVKITVETETNSNKTKAPNSLLAYKAIAQTIVRNIDNGRANYRKDDSLINQNPERIGICVSSCNGNLESSNPVEANDSRSGEKEKQHATTSPILPCKARPKNKTGQIEQISTKSVIVDSSKKRNTANEICKNISSSTKIIPHYHSKLPLPVLNNNIFHSVNANQMMLQHINRNNLNLCHSERNTLINGPTKKQSTIKNATCNKDPNLICYFQKRTTCLNGVTRLPHPDLKQAYNNSLPDNCRPNSTLLSNERNNHVTVNNFDNVNRNTSLPNSVQLLNCQDYYHYHTGRRGVPNCPGQIITGNASNTRNGDISHKNYRVTCQHCTSGYSDSFVLPNSLPRNQHATSTNVNFPNQHPATNETNVQRNPLLTQLLKQPSNVVPDYSLSMQVPPTNNLQYHHNIPNNRTHKYPSLLYPGLSSLPDLPTPVGSNAKNCIVQSRLVFDKKKIVPVNLNKSAAKMTHIDKNMTTDKEHNNNFKNYKSQESGSWANKCSCIIQNNFTQLNNLLNREQQSGEFDLHQSYSSNTALRNDIALKHKNSIAENECQFNIKTSEHVPFKVNGYSPPILPIPTFKKSLEMLANWKQLYLSNELDEITRNDMFTDDFSTVDNTKADADVTRKRKINYDEKKCERIKKISLHEYKERIFEIGKTNSMVHDNNKEKINNKGIEERCEGIESVNLECDSDSTIILV